MSDDVIDLAVAGQPVEHLDAAQARRLTDRIRDRLGDLKELVLLAYEGQIHLALGYTSWEGYVDGELGIARSHSYRLLDAARAERGLTELVGAGAVSIGDSNRVRVPEYLTRGIDVTQAVAEVSTRLNGVRDPESILTTFRRVADEFRSRPPAPDESVAESDTRHLTNIDITQITDPVNGGTAWLWESTTGWNRGWARVVNTSDPRDVLAAWSEVQTRYRMHLRGEVLEGSSLSVARSRAATHDPVDWQGPMTRDDVRGWLAPSGHFYPEDAAACRKMLAKRLALGLPTS